MDLLERDALIAELVLHLRQASAGQGALLFLSGEAGVGKSALIGRFCRDLATAERGLIGLCDPLSTPRPLGPLVDIADALRGKVADLLARGAARDQIFRAVLAALTGGAAPALVVFEDVHWADEATLDLLRFLGRRIGTTHTLVVATYRDDEVGAIHPLRLVLGDLATAAHVRRLTVPPLTESAVRALAEGSGLDPAELYRRTAGNPFFVTEILAIGGRDFPATVRDAVFGRIARLSPAGRATLGAAAVIGPRAEPWLLARVAGAEALSGDEGVAAGLLVESGEALAFRHELAREAVLGALARPHLLALHRAVLDALREGSAGAISPARLAHHAEAAGDRAATLAYALAAAREATRLSAHREAVAQYARALRVADDLAPMQRAAILEDYARECAIADDLAGAVRAGREAIATWQRLGNLLREGEGLGRLAVHLVNAGRNAEAEDACNAALALLETLPPGPQLALAYRTRAGLRMLDREIDDALAWGHKAVALAERFQVPETLSGAYIVIGSALLVTDDVAGRAYLERGGALAREAGIDGLVALSYANPGSWFAEQYRLALADRYLDVGIAYCTERDMDHNALYMVAWQALCRLYQGRWPEAIERATRVTQRPTSAAISRIIASVALGRVRARRGEPGAMPALDEALALATPTAALQRLAPVRAARAEAAALAGDRAGMRHEARAAFDRAAHLGHTWFMDELGYWLWRAGESVALPASTATPFALQVAGDWAGAAAAWERLGCPYEAARALAEGDDEGALRRALATFAHLGARPMARAVARRLRGRGARGLPRGPYTASRDNAAGLTGREREVLGLLAADLRNAEIAARLFLAPKTVEHHLSAILAKLGVRSRAEAVRAAQRLDLLPKTGGNTPEK